MKKILAVLLLLSTHAFAQTFTTNELIDPAQWSNVIRMNGNELSSVEGTGGGPVPAFNTDTNTIRFSYEPYTVGQIIGINRVLEDQGIKITGYNYSWKIYNDLFNCCNTRGFLVARVFLTGKQDNVLEQYFYDYSSTDTGASFMKFNGTQDFSKNYASSSVNYLGVEFTGSDMNYWSGYYGPRVRDASLTLNYTVASSKVTTTEPIIQNPLEDKQTTTEIATPAKTTQQDVSIEVTTIEKSTEKKSSLDVIPILDAKRSVLEIMINAQQVESTIVESATKETAQSVENVDDTRQENLAFGFSESKMTTNTLESTLVAMTQHSFSINTPEDTNPTSVRNLAALSSHQLEQEKEQNSIEQKLTTTAEVSTIATSGIQIASLQIVPNGFESYTTMILVDQKFYEPKTIYRNQRVIDNINASRVLNASSRFDQMINDQYKEK